jgi:hypothetical protein
MKQLIPVVALVPLLGVVLFYALTPREKQDISKPRPANNGKAVVQTRPNFNRRSRVQPDKELKARVSDSMAKVARIMTPERINLWLDTSMKVREAYYSGMFESWQLEPKKVDEVLEIVREREKLKLEALKSLNQDGAEGRPVFGETLSFGTESASYRLNLILGESRFREFSSLESRLEADLKAQAFKQVSPD